MPRHCARITFAVVCGAALMLAGCKNSAGVFEDQNDGGWFSKPVDFFAKPDWARPSTNTVNLGPQGPVAPEDMVSADGRCGPAAVAQVQGAAEPAAAPPSTDRAVGSVAGDLAGSPMPATPASAGSGLQRLDAPPGPSTPTVTGTIALGMTECQDRKSVV